MTRWTRSAYHFIGSDGCFYGIVGLLAVSSLWIAVSGRFPMAFDEDFHLGIIRLYAQQWTPFFAAQPAGADSFGAVVRDPSYLHHYLLSFPYRLTDALWHNQYWNIMLLRLFGIGFMLAGLAVFRRVLLRAGLRPAATHMVLLCFVLTPIVPFLAAQINYDNLLFLVVGLVACTAQTVVQRLRAGRLDTFWLALLLIICMLASLIKYSFLPIFFAVLVYVGLEARRAAAGKGLTVRRMTAAAWRGWQAYGRQMRYGMAAALVGAASLFVAMYGYNFVRYGTPIPECNQVLSAQRCTAYGAWFRNYQYAQSKKSVDPNPLSFSVHWANTYMVSSFFAVNGIYSGFIIGPPFPVLHIASLLVLSAGIPLVLWRLRRLWRQPLAQIGLIISGMYIAALWLQNYTEYLHLGQHVAENGRYLVIVLVFMYAALALAIRDSLARQPQWRGAVLLASVLVFTQGGGALTYIARSDPSWWWQNPLATRLNQSAQVVVKPLLIGSARENIKPWELK